MSLKIMNIGFASNLKPTAKLIYIAIADFANDDGECFPSQRKLAEKASVSTSTIKYYIRAFESLGIIKTEQIYKGVIPFIVIQLLVLVLMAIWPQLITGLPSMVYG